MSTKKCFKCNKIKDLDEYYKHSGTADKHLNKCKECTKKDVDRRYYDKESRIKIKEYETRRFKDPERKKKIKLYQIRRREKNPGKNRARNKLNDAIKYGRMVKLPCEVCGDTKSQAHHKDYRKYLDVQWLCFKHHRELHNQLID
jgi:hypothetical protein